MLLKIFWKMNISTGLQCRLNYMATDCPVGRPQLRSFTLQITWDLSDSDSIPLCVNWKNNGLTRVNTAMEHSPHACVQCRLCLTVVAVALKGVSTGGTDFPEALL